MCTRCLLRDMIEAGDSMEMIEKYRAAIKAADRVTEEVYVRLLCGAARSGSRVTVPEEEVVVPRPASLMICVFPSFEHSAGCVRKPADNFRTFVWRLLPLMNKT